MVTYLVEMSRSEVIEDLALLVDDDGDLVFSPKELSIKENWELERLHMDYYEGVFTVRISGPSDEYPLF